MFHVKHPARKAIAQRAALPPQYSRMTALTRPMIVASRPSMGRKFGFSGMLEMQPARIVYVSCDPATLARDCRRLSPSYRLASAASFDLFPRCAHVETVVLMSRVKE